MKKSLKNGFFFAFKCSKKRELALFLVFLFFSIKGGAIYGATTALNGGVNPFAQGDLSTQKEDPLVPKSFGLGNAYADSLFSLSTVILSRHLSPSSYSPEEETELSFVADCSERLRGPFFKERSSAAWISPFGTYARHKQHRVFPKMNHESVGALLGFDFGRWEKGVIGAGIAYAFQKMMSFKTSNDATGHQEWITAYGTWTAPVVTIEGALWVGFHQLNHKRHGLEKALAKSRIKAKMCSPHLKIDLPFEIKQVVLRPFVQWDWANLWQGLIKERGDAAMRLRIEPQYTSFLRSEFGVALSQTIEMNSGSWKLTEKVSCIHKSPFHAKRVKVSSIGSPSTFHIPLFTNQIQNFAGFVFDASFLSKGNEIPLIGVIYQGEFGSKGFGQTLALEFKKKF